MLVRLFQNLADARSGIAILPRRWYIVGNRSYPTSEHFLGHAIAVFGRGIEVVPRDVVEVEGFPEDVLDGIWGKGEWDG